MTENLKLKRSSKKHLKIETTKEKIKQSILSIPKYEKLLMDKEFLNALCNELENTINTKKYNVNKKEILLEIYTEIFQITSDQLKAISDDIEYLFEHGLIRKKSFYKKLLGFSWSFLKALLMIVVK
jgi:glutaredoxin 2